MAIGDKFLNTHSFNCASDMSASSVQYSFVKLVAGGVGLCTAETDVPVGVLQNSPALGETAVVALAGITKLKNGAANLALGARVGTNASGRAIALTAGTSTGFYAVGQVIDIDATANANGLVTAAVDCKNPGRNG
jgi:hypothetical protein